MSSYLVEAVIRTRRHTGFHENNAFDVFLLYIYIYKTCIIRIQGGWYWVDEVFASNYATGSLNENSGATQDNGILY